MPPSPPEDAIAPSMETKLMRHIERLVRDRHEAEDILQEVYIKLYMGEAADVPEARDAWLYKVATNLCLDSLRRRARRPVAAPDADPASLELAEEGPRSLQSLLERQEVSACVQRHIHRLPEAYQTVLVLYELNGLTAKEIAEMLELPLTTVKMRLHRARTMFREAFERGCVFSVDPEGVVQCDPKGGRRAD